MGYAYYAFSDPHIWLSRSISSKSADPMAVFGIQSTYKKTTIKEIDVYRDIIPLDSLKRALYLMKASLEQIHPGLYDYTSECVLDSIWTSIDKKLKPMTSRDFADLVKHIIREIADSHASLRYLTSKSIKRLPPSYFVYDGKNTVDVKASAKNWSKAW